MNEEGDMPSFSESTSEESLYDDPSGEIDNSHEDGEKKQWTTLISDFFFSFGKNPTEVNESTEKNVKLQHKLELLQFKFDTSEKEADRCKLELDETKVKLDKLNDENVALQHKLELVLFKYDTLQKEVDRYKSELDDAKEKSEKESNKLNDCIQAERNKNSHLTKELEEAKCLITQLQYEEKLSTAKIMRLEEQDTLATEFEKTSSRLGIRIAQLEEQCESTSKNVMNSMETNKLVITEELGKIIERQDTISSNITAELEKIMERQDTISSNVKTSLRSILDRQTEVTIRARIPEISELGTDKVYSRPVAVAGGHLRIFVDKQDGFLRFYLEVLSAFKWSCSAFAKHQLISQKDGNIVHAKTVEKADLFTNISGWGYNEFISFEDLFDERKGYVKDDSIIVAVDIKVFPTIGENMDSVIPKICNIS